MSEPRRIAVVTNLPTHYRRPLFERLSVRFEADFFFTSDANERYWLQQHELATDGLRLAQFKGAGELFERLRSGAYDCIVCSLAGRFRLLATVGAARTCRTPLVLWVGVWEYPRTVVHLASRPVIRRLLKTAEAVLVYGRHVAAHVAAECGRIDGVFEACQAVDNHQFRQPVKAADVARIRSALHLPGDPVVLYVGRLEPEKGVRFLLEALARTTVEQTLVFAGDGSYADELARLARRLRMHERVRFAGYVGQQRLPAHLRIGDVLVLPSIRTRRFLEPWGLIANEAMNCGVPVVATESVGAVAGGLIVDGETGRVVPERDVDALAGVLDDLARNQTARQNLASRARQRVLRWNYDAAAAGFEAAIQHACVS